jgi:hypothetical protein
LHNGLQQALPCQMDYESDCVFEIALGDEMALYLQLNCWPGSFVWYQDGIRIDSSFAVSSFQSFTAGGDYEVVVASVDLYAHFYWTLVLTDENTGLLEGARPSGPELAFLVDHASGDAGLLGISITSPRSQRAWLRFTSASGQLMEQREIQLQPGQQHRVFALGDRARGVIIVSLVHSEGVLARRLIR